MMIFVWLIIGFGIYYLFKNRGCADGHCQKRKNYDEILKQRYVDGEIDDEQYKRMLKVLND